MNTLDNYLSPYCRDWCSFEIHEELDSTNTRARIRAEEGAPEGTVIIARRQQQGRGRFGRSFFSPVGTGLYMSIVLRPAIHPTKALYITTAAAVAVAEAAETLTGEAMSIKWVNDVYYGNKKVCGILTEGQFGEQGLQYAVLGIGVNIAPPSDGFPTDIAHKAGTLFSIAPPAAIERLAAEIVERFYRLYQRLEEKPFLEAYRRRSLLNGRKVQTLSSDGTPVETVTVLGVDEEFSLVVLGEDGIQRRLSSGEVSVGL